MQVQIFAPSPWLQPYVAVIKVISCPDEQVNRILPDTMMTLALRLRGDIYQLHDGGSRLPQAVVTGLRQLPRIFRYMPGATTLLVMFRPMGAAAFFREPLHDFFSDAVSLEALTHMNDITILQEQLATAPTAASAVAMVEGFLQRRFCVGDEDRRLIRTLETIDSTGGRRRIQDVAASVGMSQDALEKAFRRKVGATPKQYASIVRIRQVLRAMQDVQGVSFVPDGFFDQAHFIKDFKRFTGLTPTEFQHSYRGW